MVISHFSTTSLHLLFFFLLQTWAKNTQTFISGPITNVTKSFTLNPHTIKLLGSATFTSTPTQIQIPNPNPNPSLKHQAGRAIYSSSIRLFDPLTQTPASFFTTFSFQITSLATSADSGGSGLTFIIVPDELTVGRPGPWLAMMNDACDEDYKAIAIEFDTRRNVEFGDPNDNHVGINLGSIVSSTTVNASDAGVFLKDGSVHRAWINYNGTYLDIFLGSDGGGIPKEAIYSAPLDISRFLNEYMFVGFSASTGNKTQIHNIISWNFTSTSPASLRFPSTETCERNLLRNTVSAKPPTSFLIFMGVVVLIIVICSNIYCISRKGKDKKSMTVILPEKKQKPRPPHKPQRFTFSEISDSTRGFSEGEILNSDSRGVFYRGTMPNGSHVAVMRFSTSWLNSVGLDRRRVVKEIGRVSRVRHPNLVSIRGWCCDNRETMIVYDYLSNGSLDRWLFGIGVLPWTRRYKVIKDVADSLSYLHSKKLAHKNVKIESVFLDVTFRGTLGDFGIISQYGDSKRLEQILSQKSDVFEFGVFVLEIVAGRRNDEGEEDERKEEMRLLDFAWRMHEKGELRKVVDPRMGSMVNLEQALHVVKIGLLCTLNDGGGKGGRVSMEDVVVFLSDIDSPIPELPPSRPVSLFPYNSATNLCGVYSCTPLG